MHKKQKQKKKKKVNPRLIDNIYDVKYSIRV